MKPLFMLALSFSAFTAFGQTQKMKIAHLENGIYKIDADTVALKKLWVEKSGFEGVNYTKMEVLKKQTFGEKKEDFYMLIAYDPAKDLKTCRYLFKINDNFYFRPSKGTDTNDLFYGTVFTCRGKDDECFPEVLYMDNTYQWGGKQKLECSKDNHCPSTRSIMFE